MKRTEPVVYVVDDDVSVRSALKSLIRSVGLDVEGFASGQDFLNFARPDVPGCIVLDVRLPGISGLDFHKVLIKAGIHLPVIFITAHGDVPMSVRAMKAGAVEFLTKPFRDQDLLDAIQLSLDQDRIRRKQDSEIAELRERFESLTFRERELLPGGSRRPISPCAVPWDEGPTIWRWRSTSWRAPTRSMEPAGSSACRPRAGSTSASIAWP
jgi:FixJ family two-component response regulator